METKEKNHAIENAIAAYQQMEEWHERIEKGDDTARDEIQEDALSVEVRSDWHTPGDGDDKPTDYKIVLTTGGPALQIIGELNEYGEPENAKLQWQDWGTPWTDIWTHESTDIDSGILLEYAQCFYFGEC